MNSERLRTAREYGLVAAELGASGSQTVMVALLPVLLVPLAPSALWIGGVIALEGVAAMLVPYVIGGLSDSLPPGHVRRLGRRNTFLVLAAPLMAAMLAVTPFLNNFWLLAGAAFLFFIGLHALNTPHLALIIDLTPEDRWGHVQGYLGSLHAVGLGYGLVAGGLLYSGWPPLPFLIAALQVLASTALTYRASPEDHRLQRGEHREHDGGTRDAVMAADAAGNATGEDASEAGTLEREGRFWIRLLRRPDLRWLLLANALWTAAVDGIRPYIFIFALVVLDITVAQTSLVLLFLLAGLAIGSVLVGHLGDRYGRGRVLLASALLTAIALSFGFLVDDVGSAIMLLVPAGLGAAALGVLPYPVFAEHADGLMLGRSTGVFRVSVGIARLAAPILVGAAIDWGTKFYPAEQGYPLMWPAAALFALLSVGALWRADRVGAQRVL